MADLTNRCASFAVRAVDADSLEFGLPDNVRNRLNRFEKVCQKQGSFKVGPSPRIKCKRTYPRKYKERAEGRRVKERERGQSHDMVARAKEAVPFREADSAGSSSVITISR